MIGKLVTVALATAALPQSCSQMNAPTLADLANPAFTVPGVLDDTPFGFKDASLGRFLKDGDPPAADGELPPEPGRSQDPPTT